MKNKSKSTLFFVSGAIMLLLSISSCTFMRDLTNPGVSTPTLQDEVGQAVAQTLTAFPTDVPTVEIILPTMTNTSLPATLTPQPTTGPTETPEPTATEEATATPTQYPSLMTGEPSGEFLLIYFDQINHEDYEAAWNNLTPAYRQNKHYNSLTNFINGYNNMDLCEVIVSDISIITRQPNYVKMFAHFIYKTGDECTPYPYDFEAHFNYDAYQGRWLLDGLTNP